ncbi:hypothetical protein [Nevskia sp.]|uniref:hypothetical protein n=1 Tax=Nevskia sp. TaxID=1929292 RepID=UPI0025DB4836|nr:hypothetical protein [Nevskia sp.]
MNPLIRVIPMLSLAAFALVGCSGDKPADAGKAAGKAEPQTLGEPAPILPVKDPKEYQRVVYNCGNNQELVLKLFDDQRARVEIDHETHVLRPVATDDGTLFLGDFVNVRVVGEKATASRNGIVLLSNCQVQLGS